MKTNSLLLSAVTVASLFGSINVRGSLIAYDPFDYPAASLTAQNGGTGFSGAYTAASSGGLPVGSPGYSYTDANGAKLLVAGNLASYVGNNQGEFRSLTGVPQTAGSTLYISYVMQLSTSTAYAGLSLFQGANETLFTGRPGGASTFGIDTKSGVTVGAPGASATMLSLLVYRIDFSAASAAITLYVNPTLGTEPAVASITATKSAALTFDTIRIQSGTDAGGIDELRFGTTYADVTPVPEPGAVALVLLGGAGMLAIRRRGLSRSKA